METNARAAGNATEVADSTRSCTDLSNESDLSNEADLSNGADSSTRADLSNGAVLLQNPDGSLQYVVLTSDEQRAAEQRAAQQKRKQGEADNGPSQQVIVQLGINVTCNTKLICLSRALPDLSCMVLMSMPPHCVELSANFADGLPAARLLVQSMVMLSDLAIIQINAFVYCSTMIVHPLFCLLMSFADEPML